jgi:hypothetical protein
MKKRMTVRQYEQEIGELRDAVEAIHEAAIAALELADLEDKNATVEWIRDEAADVLGLDDDEQEE